jgi:DNA-binding NtrC family response regulator
MHSAKLIGRSAHHHALVDTLKQVAPTDAEVLITGPSGVGKELYARYIHEQSGRGGGQFVPVNCGVLSGELLENELFGHIGGAFTGALPQRQGLVAEAEGGTLFLDEVDALTAVNQVKLLRFVQEKEYRRLGECRVRRANVRFVAATNSDLQAAMLEGRFRADLFFRLRVVPIVIAPLRERPEDIAPLLTEYIERYAHAYHAETITLTPRARGALDRYSWPGNIRELENMVRYLTCLGLKRPIEASDLPLLSAVRDSDDAQPVGREADERSTGVRCFQEEKREVVERFERDYLEQALRRSDGNIARAAHLSGKARRAFFELLRKHEIDAVTFRSDTVRNANGK